MKLERKRLRELRKDSGRTQVEVAETLKMKQASLSQMEDEGRHERGYSVSSLKRYLEALGGELYLVAVTPEGEFLLDLEPDSGEDAQRAKARRKRSG